LIKLNKNGIIILVFYIKGEHMTAHEFLCVYRLNGYSPKDLSPEERRSYGLPPLLSREELIERYRCRIMIMNQQQDELLRKQTTDHRKKMIKELLEKLNKTSETDFTTAVKIEDLSR
jgi:hypothetical protein